MPIIFQHDEENYIDKNAVRIVKSASNKQMKSGGAFRLPTGESIFSDVIKFISNNKDTIKNVGDVAKTVLEVGKTGVDVAKGISEIKAISKRTKEQILAKQNEKPNTTGSGFRIVE